MADIVEFLDREYNTTISVPDEDRYFTHWVERSGVARARLRGHFDLSYGTDDKETLDLFPAANGNRLLVFIHGGFWRGSDKSHYTWLVPPVIEAGISVALLNYALCPAVSIATIVEQCRRSIVWLQRHAADYGINAEQIIVSGHSAGGHLAAMMFATDWSAYGLPKSAITAGIALSGLFDLEPLIHTTINRDLKLGADTAKTLSPVHLKSLINAPLVAVVGALESSEFRRQTALICSAWPETCVGPMLLDGHNHFSLLEALPELVARPAWAR